jgi:hypothetical protein
MPLDKKTLSIPLAAPLSQDASDKVVDPTQVVVEAENIIYTKSGEIAKAPGYTEVGITTLTEGSHAVGSEMERLHFIGSPDDAIVVGGCTETAVGSGHYLPGNYYVAGTPAIPTQYSGQNQIYDVIGKMFPIEQEKFTAGANRVAPHSVDCAHTTANGVPVIWSAWIESGAVILSCTRAGEDKFFAVPGDVTITDMTSGVLRVRILAVGTYIHVYASKLGEIRLATFLANHFTGAVASAQVDTTPIYARAQFSGAEIDTIIRATTPGYPGDDISVNFVGTSPSGVIIYVYGNAVTIQFENGVSTAGDVEAAIAALAPGVIYASSSLRWVNGANPNITHIGCTADPEVAGAIGNSWKYTLVVSPGFVGISVTDSLDNRCTYINVQSGVGITIANVEAAIAGSAYIQVTSPAGDGAQLVEIEDSVNSVSMTGGADVGQNDIIEVQTPDTIGAVALTSAGSNQTLTLHGYQDVWDVIMAGTTPHSIIAYRNDEELTAVNAWTMRSYTPAGGAGAYGPTTFTGAPAWSLSVCSGYVSPIGSPVIFVLYQDERLDTGGIPYHYNVMLSTHTINAALTQTNLDNIYDTSTGQDRLTSSTLCDNQITEQTDGVSGLACFLEFAVQYYGSPPVQQAVPYDHVVKTLLIDPASGTVINDIYPVFGYHRILSRAIQYDERAHVWLAHESDTAPVAELVNIGSIKQYAGAMRILETEALWHRGTVNVAEQEYSPVLGSVVYASSNFYWPSVCSETQDTQVVRISRYNYSATARKIAKIGESAVVGQGQLMGFSGNSVAPHGFAYPPEIIYTEPEYDESQTSYHMQGDADYKYIAVYEWIDDNGELHQSAPSIPVTVAIPPKPLPGAATLEIVSGVNDAIGVTVTNVNLAITTTWTTRVPPGVYDNFDSLGLALSKQLMLDAIAAGVPPDGFGFYCFMSSPPTEYSFYSPPGIMVKYDGMGRPYTINYPGKEVTVNPGGAEEYVKVILGDRFHIYIYSPSGETRLDKIDFGVANTVGPSLGFTGSRDILTTKQYVEVRTWDDMAGNYISRYHASWCFGDQPITPEESIAAGRCLVRVRPYIPGDFNVNRDKMTIALYRTQANGGSYTLVNKLNSYPFTTGMFVQFDDRKGDEDIQDSVPVYTTGEPGDILENAPATPSGRALVTLGDRVWLVNEENPAEVYASLPTQSGFALAFSEFSKVVFPDNITALLPMDNYLVAFSKNAVYHVTGSGPNALGIGEFTIPALVYQNAGADNAQSVISAGDTSLFYSKEAGLWGISRGLQVTDITTQVEDILENNLYEIVSSVFRPDEQRIELYFDGGFGLYYDLRHKRWTKQTGFNNLTAACYNNYMTQHLKNASNARVCSQANVYTRNGLTYSMKIKTGWIKVNGFAGFQRIWWESIVGSYEARHNLSVKRYIDYSTTINNTKTAVLTSDPGRYLLKSKPAMQKCTAIQYVIEDSPVAGDTETEACKLTALELILGIKRTHTVKGKGF